MCQNAALCGNGLNKQKFCLTDKGVKKTCKFYFFLKCTCKHLLSSFQTYQHKWCRILQEKQIIKHAFEPVIWPSQYKVCRTCTFLCLRSSFTIGPNKLVLHRPDFSSTGKRSF